jgi:dCMP deaminase
MITNTDLSLLQQAAAAATRSKDPRTQVGALLVSPDTREMTSGYNGFPPQIPDDIQVLNRTDKWLDEYDKDDLVVHAELNALLNCKHDTTGWTLYCTHIPCMMVCTKHILAARIARVVVINQHPTTDMGTHRSIRLLTLAGVTVDTVNLEDIH